MIPLPYLRLKANLLLLTDKQCKYAYAQDCSCCSTRSSDGSATSQMCVRNMYTDQNGPLMHLLKSFLTSASVPQNVDTVKWILLAV